MSTNTTTKLSPHGQAALDYAACGIAVFPLGTRGEGRKLPLISARDGGHGFKDATTDAAQIIAWWTKTPAANIGRALGKQYGALIIEYDPRHDGLASFERLSERYGPLPRTYTVRSGSGGQHRYFRYPSTVAYIKSKDNRFGDEFPGVDVKADGGYSVAPPSIHPNGKRYEVLVDEPLADLPDAWLTALIATQPKPQTSLPPHALDGTASYAGDGNRWLDWALGHKRDGATDFYGYQLAIQLLVNQVSDPERWLREYALAATYDVTWPFDDGDISRWLRSAKESRIVRGGQQAHSQTWREAGSPRHHNGHRTASAEGEVGGGAVKHGDAEAGDGDAGSAPEREEPPSLADALLADLTDTDDVGQVYTAVPNLAQIASANVADYGRVKSQLKQHFGKSLNLNDLEKAVNQAKREQARTTIDEDGDELPLIVTNGRPLRDVTREAMRCVRDANEPPVLFTRSGALVRTRLDEDTKRPIIDLVTSTILRWRLARIANFVRETEEGHALEQELQAARFEVAQLDDLGSVDLACIGHELRAKLGAITEELRRRHWPEGEMP